MKRTTLYNILNLILLSIFVITLIVQGQFPMLNISVDQYWFPLLCFLLGVSLIIRTILFLSDSSCFFALLFIFGACIIMVEITGYINYAAYWPLFLMAVAAASLIVGLSFKTMVLIRLFVYFGVVSVPMFLLSFGVLSVGWFILVLVASLMSAVLLAAFVPERFYFNKRKGGRK